MSVFQKFQKVADGFANFTARLGIGSDNLLSQSTYHQDRLTQNRVKLEAMYRSSWLVGVIVDVVAEDSVRAGIEITGEIEPSSIQQMQTQLTRMGVWNALLRGIKLGRLYGGSLSFVVIKGQDPATPLVLDTVGKAQFSGLRVYDRWQLQPAPAQLVVDDGPDYGLPLYYDVVSDMNTGKTSGLRIHHSRVIRHIGIDLPIYEAITEESWGESVIERLHDRLLYFDSATAGAANLVHRAYLRTVQISGLREILAGGGQAEENLVKMFAYMRFVQSNEGITLLDGEDTFATHNYSFAGLNDIMQQFGMQLAGASGIPMVRWFGVSPGGLNATGESDLRFHYDNINSQQESRMRDGMTLILRVLHRSLFGAPAPDDMDFAFTPLWQTGVDQKVKIASELTASIVSAHDAGIVNAATALKELKQSSEYTGVWSNIEDQDIDDAVADPPPEPGS